MPRRLFPALRRRLRLRDSGGIFLEQTGHHVPGQRRPGGAREGRRQRLGGGAAPGHAGSRASRSDGQPGAGGALRTSRPGAGVSHDVGTRRQASAGAMIPMSDMKPGVIVTIGLAVVLLAFALSVNVPKEEGGGFKGDEATYYVLGHSLVDDFDFAFTHADLERVWQEYSTGPEGIFLK